MTTTDDDSARQTTLIVSMTATGETEEGLITISIELANAPGRGGAEIRLSHALTRRIMRALDVRTIGGGSDGRVRVQVPRDGIEEAVRAIRGAMSEFNEAYPELLAEHRREFARQEADNAAKKERLAADQQRIDRAMQE